MHVFCLLHTGKNADFFFLNLKVELICEKHSYITSHRQLRAGDLAAWPCGPTSWWPGHPMTSTLPFCHGTSRPLRASALRAIIGSVSPVWLMRFKSCPRPGLKPWQRFTGFHLRVTTTPWPALSRARRNKLRADETRRDETRRGAARVNFCGCHYQKSQVSLRFEKKMGVFMRGL